MKKLDFSAPAESDRIIGFTIPQNGSFFICDHDEVWKVDIGAAIRTEVTEENPYDFVGKRRDFLGLVFKDYVANSPLQRVGENEIFYDFDPKNDAVTVRYTVAGRKGTIEFPTCSGDWFAASFSVDGRYLVIAEPYRLDLYQVE